MVSWLIVFSINTEIFYQLFSRLKNNFAKVAPLKNHNYVNDVTSIKVVKGESVNFTVIFAVIFHYFITSSELSTFLTLVSSRFAFSDFRCLVCS